MHVWQLCKLFEILHQFQGVKLLQKFRVLFLLFEFLLDWICVWPFVIFLVFLLKQAFRYSVANLISELNATSVMEMGGLDYDTIVHAYEKISMKFFNTIPKNQALVILPCCIYDMSSNELTLRHSAYRLLVSFVEFSVPILKLEVKSDHEMSEAMVTSIADGYWTEACIQRMINKILLKLAVCWAWSLLREGSHPDSSGRFETNANYVGNNDDERVGQCNKNSKELPDVLKVLDTFSQFVSEMKDEQHDAKVFAFMLQAMMEELERVIRESKLAELMNKHSAAKNICGHSWFALNPVSPTNVEVKGVHHFDWLTRKNVPVLETVESYNGMRSYFLGNHVAEANLRENCSKHFGY
ncbi:hypothetical protein PVL29_003886 [Vitis rotundifolia]|uniref:U3 small nucleolar RNA-associated protein 20 N-terminal domain-containing protein n=1 Tax=Vitis rotundifolia TaxID=103349 RepID=A0AA39A7G0_VITRO|nr:hypothetical protein PVL29_003886 [Vitis rotundifolia]